MRGSAKTAFYTLRGLDFEGWNIPHHTRHTLRNYYLHGLIPGNFVEYMLLHADNITSNTDIKARTAISFAQCHADGLNKPVPIIVEIAKFIRINLPPESWGSYENINNWMWEFWWETSET